MLKNWEMENTWSVIGMIVVIAALAIGVVWIFAPKEVDYYYLSTSNSEPKAIGFCAYAHWTWHSDEIAYCSDDKDRVLDFVAKANATLPKH